MNNESIRANLEFLNLVQCDLVYQALVSFKTIVARAIHLAKTATIIVTERHLDTI